MKKITLLFACLLVSFFGFSQATCTQTFSTSGPDSGPTVLTINAADLSCNGAETPTALALVNPAGSLNSSFCTTNGSSWFGFQLSVDGGTPIQGCGADFNNIDITGFTSLTITSQDDDAFTDTVTITIDVEVTFNPSTPPNCDAVLTETTDVSILGNVSWSAATGAPTAYDLTVGTTSGGDDVLTTTDVGNVTTFNIGTLEFSTTYYVTLVPKNDNGTATGCVEQTFVTRDAPTPPATIATININSCGDSGSATVTYNVGEVAWVEVIYAGGCDDLTIDTFASTIGDSEIGIYFIDGTLIGSNDDAGGGLLSEFVATGLPAGTYYVAASSWNVTFGAEFAVSTADTDDAGDITITVSTPSNETADFVNLQFPFEATIVQGGTANVFAQIFEAGITEPAGQGAGIQAWIGVSDTNATTVADFETADWTWIPATYNVDNFNNDEYQAAIGAGLVPGTYYYVSRFSVLGGPFAYGGINPGGSDGNFWDGTNFVSGVLTVTPPPPPANDLCSGAINLTAGNVFDDNPLVGTNVGATGSGELPLPGCAVYDPADPTGFGGDVWYSVTIPSDGNLTIQTNANPTGSGGDSGIAVYSGTCGALALVECDDDDSPDGAYSQVVIEPVDGLADQLVYIRVWEFGGNAELNFQISAYSATLSTDSFENDNSLKFYPNPVKNTLTLNAQNNIEQITVFNMLGQAVIVKTVNSNSVEIDMGNLVSGTYFAQVTINGIIKTVKVLKD